MAIPSVNTTCESCGTSLVIVPPTIGRAKSPDDAPSIVELPEVPDGSRLTEAKQDGHFVCPTCGTEGEAVDLRLE
jgi:predicted RNA-binding Zn-ribbon protein involved in translation (DUF1610 family)